MPHQIRGFNFKNAVLSRYMGLITGRLRRAEHAFEWNLAFAYTLGAKKHKMSNIQEVSPQNVAAARELSVSRRTLEIEKAIKKMKRIRA